MLFYFAVFFVWIVGVAILLSVTESHGIALLVTAALVGALYFFSYLTLDSVIAFLLSPMTWIGIATYAVIGILWGFVKWYFYLLRYRDKHTDMGAKKGRFGAEYDALVAKNDPDVVGISRSEYILKKLYVPTATSNKYLISIWIVWWPFSAISTLAGDVLTRLVNIIIDKFMWLYNQITLAVFKDF